MSSQNANGFQNMRKHKYYIDTADLTVIVENARFKIHSHFLTRESPVFAQQVEELEPLSAISVSDRSAPSALGPIFLDSSVRADDFGKLLSVFYPEKYIYEKPAEDWHVILGLAIKWSFNEVRDLCIRELTKDNVPIATRLAIFEANNVDPRIVRPLYGVLAASELPLTLSEMERLGTRTSWVIMTARERLRSAEEGGRSPLPDERRAQVGSTLRAIFESISPVNASPPTPSPNGTVPNGAGSNTQGTSGQTPAVDNAKSKEGDPENGVAGQKAANVNGNTGEGNSNGNPKKTWPKKP